METYSYDCTVKIHIVALVNAEEFQRRYYEVVIYVSSCAKINENKCLP